MCLICSFALIPTQVLPDDLTAETWLNKWFDPLSFYAVVSTKIVSQQVKRERDQCRLVLWVVIVWRYLLEVHEI